MKEIIKATVISTIATLVATILVAAIMMVCMPSDPDNVFWIMMMAPIIGAIIASPVILRQENRIHHFKKVMKKNKGL